MRAILIILEILLLGIGVLSLQSFDRQRTAEAYADLAASPTQENKLALQSVMRKDKIADNTIRATIGAILIINTCGIIWLGKRKQPNKALQAIGDKSPQPER